MLRLTKVAWIGGMNYFAIAFGAIAALTVVALDYSLHVSKAGAADAPPESYMASVQTRLGAPSHICCYKNHLKP